MSEWIDVFVKSFVVSPDLDKLFYSAQHTACAPDLLKYEAGKFRGRVLDPESAALLSDIRSAENQLGLPIRIWDLGRIRGRIKGIFSGVKNAPALAMNGNTHIGLKEARIALSGFRSEVEV